MRSNANFFERIPNAFIIFSIAFIVFLKIIIYVLVKNNLFNVSLGGGVDADYYDAYATGNINIALNIWPIILRYLDSYDLYSRETTSYFLFFLSIIVIPIIVTKLAKLSLRNNQKYYLYIFLFCSIYATLFFFSFDIYRDVFMVFSFLVGCLIVKNCLESSNYIIFLILFMLSILIGFFLLGLRPYLGYAFLISLFLWKIKFTKRKLILLGVLYFAVLFIANYIGALEVLTEYRSGFEETKGGSTLGLNFSNPLLFIPNFIFSALGQLFGLYITNPLAIVLLLIETVPFLLMFVYVIKNIRWADKFVRFLIIFFVLYASVWLIGNDNLGTAVRLRLYNYFAIYISFFYILNLKEKALKKYIG